MNIRERYNIEETQNSFSLYPNKTTLKLSKWFLTGITACIIALLFLDHYFDDVMRGVIYILIIYFVLHSLYDILIGSKIQYTFVVTQNAVYKQSPLFSKKKIMKLDETVIFVQSEMGSWYYALGANKSHFVKNYRISEGFSSGRKSLEIQAAYENFVLQKIDKLIDAVHLELKN